MKKLFLCLLLTLSLTACGMSGASGTIPGGQTEPAGTDATIQTETAQTAQTSGDRAPTAEELGREATADLTFVLEGQEETEPAALYIGQGYSLYIPTEGWVRESFTENGVPADSWESAGNERAELRILHLGDRSLADSREWIVREFDRYMLSEDKRGDLYGEDAENGMVLDVRFYEGGSVYAVLWAYPAEAAEGFGTRLSVIADTFEAMS